MALSEFELKRCERDLEAFLALTHALPISYFDALALPRLS